MKKEKNRSKEEDIGKKKVKRKKETKKVKKHVNETNLVATWAPRVVRTGGQVLRSRAPN